MKKEKKILKTSSDLWEEVLKAFDLNWLHLSPCDGGSLMQVEQKISNSHDSYAMQVHQDPHLRVSVQRIVESNLEGPFHICYIICIYLKLYTFSQLFFLSINHLTLFTFFYNFFLFSISRCPKCLPIPMVQKIFLFSY